MAWNILIQELVYLLTFIGTFLEGEITIMTSAFQAYLGNLNIFVVIAIGYLGILCADNWWFYVGKKYGTRFVNSHPHLQKRAKIVQQLLEKNQFLVVMLYRYAWGFRLITPIILGTTHITRLRFFIYTLFTTTFWTIIFTSIGYRFGAQLAAVIAYVRSVEIAIFTIIVCVSLFYVYQTYEEQLKKQVKHSVRISKKIHRRIRRHIEKTVNKKHLIFKEKKKR